MKRIHLYPFSKIVVIIFSISVSASGCSNRESETVKFQRFISSLPSLKTPYLIECGLNKEGGPSIQGEDSVIIKQMTLAWFVVGKIFHEKEFVALLCGTVADDNHASIYSFTPEGIKIDSIDLAHGCGVDHGFRDHYLIIIDTNKKIITIDTTWETKVDSHGKLVLGSDSTFIQIKAFQLLNTGRFAILEHNKKQLAGTINYVQ
jgi:hypothetical protein